MTPLQLQAYYKDSPVDFIGDQVLELIGSHMPKTPIGQIVAKCLVIGISSPMTTFRKIEILEENHLIVSTVAARDQRLRQLSITAKGQERLKRWGT
jgi:DNA-binding MarR family transcriptional regulator